MEVYPLRLNLIDSRDNSESIIRLSKKVMVAFVYFGDIFLDYTFLLVLLSFNSTMLLKCLE